MLKKKSPTWDFVVESYSIFLCVCGKIKVQTIAAQKYTTSQAA